jgi:hypothetical protein
MRERPIAIKAASGIIAWTQINGDAVLLGLIGLIEGRPRLIELVVQIRLFEKRQKQHRPTEHLA